MQFHINLRLPPGSTGLTFFPGTHKQLIFPCTAFHLLLDSGVDFDRELALKSLILGERITMKEVVGLRSDDKQHFIQTPDGRGGTQPVHDFLIGMYCTLLWHQLNPDGHSQCTESKTYADSENKFVAFNPAIFHCTEEARTVDDACRISLGIRVMKIPDVRAFQMGRILTNPAVRWAYRNFVNDDLEMLADSCIRFGALYEQIPHRQVMSFEEVANRLFGHHNVDADTLVHLSPACADDVKPPFVSLSRLKDLNREAIRRLDESTATSLLPEQTLREEIRPLAVASKDTSNSRLFPSLGTV
jgi:hypothetical protein